jgi:hypothetical protein
MHVDLHFINNVNEFLILRLFEVCRMFTDLANKVVSHS